MVRLRSVSSESKTNLYQLELAPSVLDVEERQTIQDHFYLYSGPLACTQFL